MQQTVDADANLLLVSEVIPACGSSFFCVAAADAEETEEAVLAADVTTACGLSFCSAAAADLAETDITTTAAASACLQKGEAG